MLKNCLQALLLLISFFPGAFVFYYLSFNPRRWSWVIPRGIFAIILALITGLILGLGLAKLIFSLFDLFAGGVWQVFFYVISALGLSYLGITSFSKKAKEISLGKYFEKIGTLFKKFSQRGIPKVVDTTPIIGGRILEFFKIGWLKGPLYLLKIVVKEIQILADSLDPYKKIKAEEPLIC